MAKRQGILTDLMDLGSKLPWQAGAGLALLTGVIFHVITIKTASPTTPSNVADLGSVVEHQFIHVVATILQYLVPAALLIGAAVSFFKRLHRRSLFTKARSHPMATVSSMTWRQFEMLVGESFRHRGFDVAEVGGNGPDGGIDLVLSKSGEQFLVQCKQWRARQVSVTVVRELYGVMAAQGATGGYVVTAGQFTRDAREFAEGRNIQLVDADSITGLIGDSEVRLTPNTPHVLTDPILEPTAPTGAAPTPPACPRCGIPMVERVAKQGQYAGQSFWGCSRYPTCREIVRTA